MNEKIRFNAEQQANGQLIREKGHVFVTKERTNQKNHSLEKEQDKINKYLHSQKAYAVCSNQKLPSHKICYSLHQRIFFPTGFLKEAPQCMQPTRGVLTLRFSSEFHMNLHSWRRVTQAIVLQVQNRCNQMKSITMCVV